MNAQLPIIYGTQLQRQQVSGEEIQQKSIVHRLVLALVALTVASGAVVFTEPAPFDFLSMVLIVLLPVVGLVAIKPAHAVFLSFWLVIAACAFFAASFAPDTGGAVSHTAISLYLYVLAFVFAAFVAKNPAAHVKLVLDSYSLAAIVAAVAALIGYFDLIPGTAELFTKYGRATGPFKDPNVFGAFLTLAVVKQLHDAVSRRGAPAFIAFAALGLLMLGVLLSFSRGAWAACGIGVFIYSYLAFVTAKRNIERVKLVCLGLASFFAAGMLVGVALQFDAVSKLLEERASLSQSYDVGPEGRFGGQAKARALILENPLGIGAGVFKTRHHTEEAHNVYLSMFLNAGWLGGFMYLMVAGLTVLYGLRHALKRTATQPYFIVIYAVLVATLLEGTIIDSDHWRHLYVLIGLTWGLMIADQRIVRTPRILSDRQPILLRSVLVIPPPRRCARALRPYRPALPAPAVLGPFPSRKPRIAGPARPVMLAAPAGKAS